MDEIIYKTALIILIIVFLVIRVRDVKRFQKRERKINKSTKTDLFLLGFNTFGMVIIPVIYCLSTYFDGFMMHLSDTIRVFGVFIYAASFLLMYFVLKELKGDWSMKLEIWKGHRLVTTGPYRYVRHPMYTAFFMMMAGQLLLTSNWFVGLFGIISFVIIYIYKIPREEMMLKEEFGQSYSDYRENTKKIIPYIF